MLVFVEKQDAKVQYDTILVSFLKIYFFRVREEERTCEWRG